MPIRFKVLAVVFCLLILIANDSVMRPFDNIVDVFVALGSLLVLSAIALWPNPSRADRVDRAMTGESWADRIDFKKRQTPPAE
ncbi:MAG: hypothetical protein AB1749_11530 [Pseudomonadota bacterium]